ncbi:hypothetical protein OIU76_027190, partial [Salix suchowensis]
MPSALSQTSLHSFIPGAYPTAVKCFWGCKANVGDGSHFGSSIARLMSHNLWINWKSFGMNVAAYIRTDL